MKKEKILFVISTLKQGGAERVAVTLCEEWQKLGHDVRLIVFSDREAFYQPQVELEFLHLEAFASSFVKRALVSLLRVVKLARLFHQHKPTQIVSFMESANLVSCLGAVLSGHSKNLKISIRSNPDQIQGVTLSLAKILYRVARKIIVPSKEAALLLGGILQRSDSDIAVIPNPLNPAFLSQSSERPDERSSIVYVGRLSPEKGVDVLLRAFAMSGLWKSHRLKLVGDGPSLHDLQNLARELKIFECIDWCGQIKDVLSLYASARLFVLPSYHEGWPNALVEALALGTPSVSSDCSFGPREISELCGGNVKLFPVGDYARLSQVMIEALNDSTWILNTMSSRSQVGAAFAPHVIAASWLEV